MRELTDRFGLIKKRLAYIHSVTIPTSVARKWIGARVTPQFQLELPELETLMPVLSLAYDLLQRGCISGVSSVA